LVDIDFAIRYLSFSDNWQIVVRQKMVNDNNMDKKNNIGAGAEAGTGAEAEVNDSNSTGQADAAKPPDLQNESTPNNPGGADSAAASETNGSVAAGGAGSSGTEQTISRDKLRELLGDECDELLAAKEKVEVQARILEEKDKLLGEYEDLLKRKQAEFENYRKRVQRELEDFRKYATSELVLDIINIIDDFERAIGSAESSRDFDTLLEGIRLVEKQLRSILEKKHGVEKIEAVGKEFDPTVHDAIMMEETEEFAEDTVVDAFQSGYRMHDRVIRPAKVKVAKAVSPGSGSEVNASESSEKGD
jgi:molecular chaperone GrpE